MYLTPSSAYPLRENALKFACTVSCKRTPIFAQLFCAFAHPNSLIDIALFDYFFAAKPLVLRSKPTLFFLFVYFIRHFAVLLRLLIVA